MSKVTLISDSIFNTFRSPDFVPQFLVPLINDAFDQMVAWSKSFDIIQIIVTFDACYLEVIFTWFFPESSEHFHH